MHFNGHYVSFFLSPLSSFLSLSLSIAEQNVFLFFVCVLSSQLEQPYPLPRGGLGRSKRCLHPNLVFVSTSLSEALFES